MSLLQEIEKYGLADCKFNRQFFDDYELRGYAKCSLYAINEAVQENRQFSRVSFDQYFNGKTWVYKPIRMGVNHG